MMIRYRPYSMIVGKKNYIRIRRNCIMVQQNLKVNLLNKFRVINMNILSWLHEKCYKIRKKLLNNVEHKNKITPSNQ